MSLPIGTLLLVASVLTSGTSSVKCTLLESKGPVFLIEPPPVVQFSNDTGGTIQCTAHGSPAPKINWILGDGTRINSLPNIREIMDNGSLYFPPFSAESYRHEVHSNSYRCQASNVVGLIVSREVHLKAVVDQLYETSVNDVFVLPGNTAILRCDIPAFVKEHVSVTSWIQDTTFNIYPSTVTDGKFHMLPTGEFVMYSVTTADTHATFRCRTVHHITGKSVVSVNHARIIVTENRGGVPPRYSGVPHVPPVRSGLPVALFCVSQGFPSPNYWWFKSSANGDLEPVTPTERVRMRAGILLIENTRSSDNGRYVCHANNSAGSERVELDVTVIQTLSTYIIPKQTVVDVGKEAEFVCVVSGRPRATTTWVKDGVTLLISESYRVETDNKGSRLYLKKVLREDHGMYQCLAKNDFDNAQGTTELRLGDTEPMFVYKFIEQTMQPGPRVSLKCSATGNPTPHFTWYHDRFKITHTERLLIGQKVTVNGDVISHMNISSVRVEDGGEYRCTAKNRVGEVSHAARLNVYGIPHVRSMASVFAISGSDFVIKCPVSGYPISSVTWKKGAQFLPLYRRQEVSPNGTLVIHNVDSKSDRGTYSCSAQNNQGHQDSKSVFIDVKVPPKIEHFSFPEVINEGSRVHVTCVVSQGDPPMHIEWQKDGKILNEETVKMLGASMRQIGHYDLALLISDAKSTHDGNYTCVARNEAAQVTLTDFLRVHVPPRIAPFSFNKNLSEGVRAQVTCVIEQGDPPFTITWLKDSDSIPSDTPRGLKIIDIDAHSSTIVVENLTANHTGNFTCLAKNSVAEVAYTAKLVVSVPPRWSIQPQDTQLVDGSLSASVHCQAEGVPSPNITWRVVGKSPGMYQDIDQEESESFYLHSNGTLVIKRVAKKYQGYYLCEAMNGIGPGLSKVIYIAVNVPPHFEIKYRNETTKLGENTIISCEVQGDHPLKIIWHKGSVPLDTGTNSYRYIVNESNTTSGIVSELKVSNTKRTDSGRYTCTASNLFGRDQTIVHLYVQEPPDLPRNVHEIQKTSRSIKVGWQLSPDGNTPVTQYTVEYKWEKEFWHEHNQHVSVGGSKASAHIDNLRPATLYNIRVFAENDLGRSQPSSVIDVKTNGEAPGGPPRNLKVKAISSTELQVNWDPPEQTLWNGEILGYHIGFKEQRVKSEQYQFRSVESKASHHSDDEEVSILADLKKFTNYSVVVQAYNVLGDGPISKEVMASTLEDVPSAPPQSLSCTAISSQSMAVTWDPPPHNHRNGFLRGYKLFWENAEVIQSTSKPETKIVSSQNAVIHGLEKYSKYNIYALAYTKKGDGVASQPIQCTTDEDIPDAPAAIKAVVSSSTSIIVSWLPPKHANGVVIAYKFQAVAVGTSGQVLSKITPTVPPTQEYYEADNLKTDMRYEFDVAAVTKIGEGPQSSVITLSPTHDVRAAIYSFGSTAVYPWKENVKLFCQHVGRPKPSVSWWQGRSLVKFNNRLKTDTGATLMFYGVQRNDSGNYSCHVENKYGTDIITHKLIVQVPPSAPKLHVAQTTSHSVTLRWELEDDGGSPVRSFILTYHRIDKEWEEIKINRLETTYLLDKLVCGTSYQVFVAAQNSIGVGTASETIHISTYGGKPVEFPDINRFLVVNSTSAVLHLHEWGDGGCQITKFEVQYKSKEQKDFFTVPDSLYNPKGIFTMKDLLPATEYQLRVTAHNDAGSVTGDYRFMTLNSLGATVTPSWKISDSELNFFSGSILAAVVTVIVLFLVGLISTMTYCYVKKRRCQNQAQCDNPSENQETPAKYFEEDVENSQHVYGNAHPSLSLERIPECAEEISPYATFSLNPVGSDETRCASSSMVSGSLPSSRTHTLLYHDSRYSAAETILIQGESTSDAYSKYPPRSRRKPKSIKSETVKCGSVGSECDIKKGPINQIEFSKNAFSSAKTNFQTRSPGTPSHHLSASERSNSRHSCGHDYGYNGPESSTSTEPSPVCERKSFSRRNQQKMSPHRSIDPSNAMLSRAPEYCLRQVHQQSSRRSPVVLPSNVQPPPRFSDSIELSEAECDLESTKRNRNRNGRKETTRFHVKEFSIPV